MALDTLLDFYHRLTPESVNRFAEFYTEDAYFKDPFNEVRGISAIERIFRHMFTQVGEPRFIVTEKIAAGKSAMLVWEFHFRVGRWGRGESQIMRGVSHLRFDDNGKVSYHRDYWDTAEELYMKVPGLSLVMRGLRHALSA